MIRKRRWKPPATKPRLPMKTRLDCRVRYKDLEAYLAKVYRMDGYSVLKALGATNGMCPEYLVTGDLPPAANILQQVDAIRRGRKTRDLGLILNLLCRDGFIPAGKYVIETHAPADPIAVYTALLNETGDPDDPCCTAFRVQHSKDREFQRRANMLDREVKRERA